MKRWTVSDVMTREVVWVPEQATYHEIVGKMAAHAVSALPVLDAKRRVVGVVSEADLLRKIELGMDERIFLRPSRRAAKAKSSADRAAELMTSPAVTVSPASTLAQAAKILAAQQVKRLPVVDSEGRLQGIVSRADLLKAYLRSDDDIRMDIVNGVFKETMWIDPKDFAISVHEGKVRLAGETDRKSAAQLLAYFTGIVPGVVEVESELTWGFDDTRDSTGYFRSHPFDAEVTRP
ncbi:CBS domain-containing protein [Catelliglobosispora koreensis]|uniref:CBS domain-containing protein n=1 Tax=Catelliglobosispora koreensis TaxID=129052 RepID=UPI000364FED5|nr:CBS domain-containing protein [Catelliglobosispora koreensis]